MRKLLFATAIAILAWAALVVPVPLASLAPVPAQPVEDVIEITGQPVGDLPDDVLFTAIELRQPTTVGAIAIAFDEDRSLTFLPAVIPAGVDPEQFVQLQERQFRESIRVATAMGLRAAGRDVQISGEGARVVRVLPGTPAADVLQQEDVITAIDGEEISLASQLPAALADAQAGDEVELTIQRDDRTITRSIELAELSRTGQVGLGVLVSTVSLEIQLPVDVQAAPEARVGGPSAGLMVALAVYDATTESDLGGGRVIAGTGTIGLAGEVGPVSGIAEKVAGAVEAGADVFLVPEAGAATAREAAPDTLEVIAVTSLDDAIGALTNGQ